jgi:site-specific recombinase XerD
LNRHIKRLGAKTKIGFPVRAHMLWHACGYALANKGHDARSIRDHLGHKSIQHTVRYTEAVADAFQRLLESLALQTKACQLRRL